MEECDESRRQEEFEALEAVYGDDAVRGSSPLSWRVRLTPQVVLELDLPKDYPSTSVPTPLIHAKPWIVGESQVGDLTKDMVDMWIPDTEVAILWAEHCRMALEDQGGVGSQVEADEADSNNDDNLESDEVVSNEAQDGTQTFVPPTSRFGQPMRHFPIAVIDDEANRRDIHRGMPFHPPKSGPSETLIAHVASVTSMDHVQWVLAELLFKDRKVGKASHNMIAYRFYDEERQCLVSDNDDDGEKGAGSKLAALLELSNSENVMVVVSRWFGGVLLGPSRFKYIAAAARDALMDAGYISTNSKDEDVTSGKRRVRK